MEIFQFIKEGALSLIQESADREIDEQRTKASKFLLYKKYWAIGAIGLFCFGLFYTKILLPAKVIFIFLVSTSSYIGVAYYLNPKNTEVKEGRRKKMMM